MTRRDKRTILLATTILKNAAKTPHGVSAQTEAVQLALRVLLPHVDRHTLMTYWDIAGQEGGHHRIFRLNKMMQTIDAVTLRRMAGL